MTDTAEAIPNVKPLITKDELERDFAHITEAVNTALALKTTVPPVIEDEEDLSLARTAVRAMAAARKRVSTTRVDAKEPFLSGGRVVDSHFNSLEKILVDEEARIGALAKHHLDKKAAEEQRKRDEEARIAREAAAKAQRERDAAEAEQRRLDQEAADARKRAQDAIDEEARKKAAEEAAEAQRVADSKKAATSAAGQQADAAAATAVQSQRAAEASPADKARTRVDDGMATLERSYEFKIESVPDIDLDALRAYIGLPDIEKAIRAYIRTHKDTKPLRGVKIFATTNASFR